MGNENYNSLCSETKGTAAAVKEIMARPTERDFAKGFSSRVTHDSVI